MSLMLSLTFMPFCYYAKCRYAKCHYAEYPSAECRGALKYGNKKPKNALKMKVAPVN
jgi:hypothetical protein